MAVQDQSVQTNRIKVNVDRVSVSALCSMYGKRDDAISDIVSECKCMAQKEYKKLRQDSCCNYSLEIV